MIKQEKAPVLYNFIFELCFLLGTGKGGFCEFLKVQDFYSPATSRARLIMLD